VREGTAMNEGGAWKGWEGASPMAKFAMKSLAVVVVATTAAAIVLPGDWKFVAVLVGLFLLGYVPVTPFALRAKIGNGVLRYLFGLTAVPLFMVLFVWILHRLFTELPQLEAAYGAQRSSGLRMPGIGHGAMVTVLTSIVFGAWYGLVRGLDQAIRGLAAPAATAVASLFALAAVSAALYLAYDSGYLRKRPAPAPVVERTPGGSQPSGDWMSAGELMKEFEYWKPNSYYPQRIEGVCERGALRYRADWKVAERGQRYFFYFGLPRERFDRHDGALRGQGFTRDSTSVFRDCEGGERYQGTWTLSAPRP
jgi:predicted secreted protein